MAQANPIWGAPRIHGELLKLGIDVCRATVAKYMPRRLQPPSQNLADVPAESCQSNRGGRFLRGPDRDLPPLVRLGVPRPRPATDPAHCGHRPPDGGVDGSTTAKLDAWKVENRRLRLAREAAAIDVTLGPAREDA
jgi:hypothetical protein